MIPVFDRQLDPQDSFLAGILDAEALNRALTATHPTLGVGEHAVLSASGIIPASQGNTATPGSILAVELGAREALSPTTLRRAAGAASRTLSSLASKAPHRPRVATTLGTLGMREAVEGFLLGGYRYDGFRSERSRTAKLSFMLPDGGDTESATRAYRAALITAEAVNFARDLVNTPASHLFPARYARILATRAKEHGVKTEVLGTKKLREQRFGGVLAVSAGSARAPRVVRLEWKPAHPTATVGLVGKGITFDTGGVSLKRASKMEDMISDMGGSAAMAAAVLAAAQLELPVHVIATLPLAENMPDGGATRPGDVITHYGGVTSEVLNTDAEGRLVLADALARASEDHPDYLIDAATLTGAQLVALGNRTAGVMGTSDELRDCLAETGRAVDEPAWSMPLLPEHEDAVRSPIADIRNVPNAREGGMLYAATYLSRFVGEGIKWAHLDVAGPAFNTSSAYGFTPTRATGAPVRTILAFLGELSGTHHAKSESSDTPSEGEGGQE